MTVDLLDLSISSLALEGVTHRHKDQATLVPQKSAAESFMEVNDDRDDESVPSDIDDSDASFEINIDVQRREARRAAFNEYVQGQEEADRSAISNEVGTPLDNIKAQASYIIDQARDYQQELFERAKKENVIAVYAIFLP